MSRILLLLILSLLVERSIACTCSRTVVSNVEAYNKVDILFTGTILKIEQKWGQLKVFLSVDIPLKNCQASDTVVIHTSVGSGSCGLSVREGEYWAMWGYDLGNENYHATNCGRSRWLKNNHFPPYLEDLKELSGFTGSQSWQHRNGSIGAQGRMNEGKPEGDWTYYYEDGSIKSQGQYQNGWKTGKWYDYKKAKGMLVMENDTMLVNKLYMEKILTDTAFDKYELSSVDTTIIELRSTTEYKQGKRHGEQCYFKDGVVSRRYYYREDKEYKPKEDVDPKNPR